MKVYPKEGLRVAFELRPKHYIPPEGAEVPERPYYLRRLRDGDIVLGVEAAGAPMTDDPPAPDPAPTKPRRRSRPTAEE